MIQQKLKYYRLKGNFKPKLRKKIIAYRKNDFIFDLRPFVPIHERKKLGETFDFIQNYLMAKV